MRKSISFAIILVFIAIMGCSKIIDRDMVVGEYTANHKKAIDTLELRPDGSYVYHYKAPTGEEFTNVNRWRFEYENGKPTLTFSKFIFRLPGYSYFPEPGFWVVEVERSSGKLRLCIDPDLNYYYIKQE